MQVRKEENADKEEQERRYERLANEEKPVLPHLTSAVGWSPLTSPMYGKILSKIQRRPLEYHMSFMTQ